MKYLFLEMEFHSKLKLVQISFSTSIFDKITMVDRGTLIWELDCAGRASFIVKQQRFHFISFIALYIIMIQQWFNKQQGPKDAYSCERKV